MNFCGLLKLPLCLPSRQTKYQALFFWLNAGLEGKRKSKKALPFFFLTPPPFFGGWIVVESGEIPVIVPFSIKRDNSVNGTVREHPVWRRCWCVRLPCAAGAPRGCRTGAALQWILRPARPPAAIGARGSMPVSRRREGEPRIPL